MGNVLLVEDEAGIAQSLKTPLDLGGYHLIHALTIKEAWDAFKREDLDAILLDLNLPDGNGIDFCREVRKESSIPILMLTARRDEMDRVLGLELGADDYIVKPFSPREVVARINAVLRRRSWERKNNANKEEEIITHCGITIYKDRREVSVEGRRVQLTRTEYKLLSMLMERPGMVFSRDQIVDGVWEGNFIIDRVVDSVVSRIRRKLGKMKNGKHRIRTVHGVGYGMAECPNA